MLPGTPCGNCGTVLVGRFCHVCGQSVHDYHRSAWHLAQETFESLFHADGRLWRTMVRLLRDPARLTRDYLAGKRAPQIPPLRLFFVVLLVLFLIGNWHAPRHLMPEAPPAALQSELQSAKLDIGLPAGLNSKVATWLRAHVGRAVAHPDDLAEAMRERAENFAILMLPISALLLAAIFALRRGFVLFDHLVFSMHSLSFQGLLISLVLLTGQFWLLCAAPVHLFAHMRGVYGTGRLGTLVRMAVLAMFSLAAFVLLLAALVLAGLELMRD